MPATLSMPMRLVSAVFALLLLALAVAAGGASAGPVQVPQTMPRPVACVMSTTQAETLRPTAAATVESASGGAVDDSLSDADDRGEAIASGAGPALACPGLRSCIDALADGMPLPWLGGLLRPPRILHG